MQIEALKMTPVASSAESHITKNNEDEVKSFGDYFAEALHNVNDLQMKGRDATLKMAAGKAEDISQVVIATEKAGIALQLTMQVRNKAVDAYQEIMRMQV